MIFWDASSAWSQEQGDCAWCNISWAEGMALPGSGSSSMISMEHVGNHRSPKPLGLWRTVLAFKPGQDQGNQATSYWQSQSSCQTNLWSGALNQVLTTGMPGTASWIPHGDGGWGGGWRKRRCCYMEVAAPALGAAVSFTRCLSVCTGTLKSSGRTPLILISDGKSV